MYVSHTELVLGW